jgi:STE24 endopeptidase
MFTSWNDFVFELAFWILGFPPAIWAYTAPTSEKWAKGEDGTLDPILFDFYQAMLFSLVIALISLVGDWPCSLIKKFMIEESHGFNKQTLGGWLKDQLKAFLVQIILLPPLLYGLLWIIYSTGDNFYLYAGIFLTVGVLVLVILMPFVIMPIFNKFEPLEENQIKKDIEALASDVNYPLQKVEVVDGSQRSSHSNAYQYGIGKIKKVVLFDTLLE